jgi:phosphoribosyl 1,2-cyclic phosphate phosphodiesterase
MSKQHTSITLLGTGTSQGVPVIACNCPVCTSTDPRDKRLRSSAMFTVDGVNIVVDTGPDFRQQMLRHNVQDVRAVVFTHAHKDHTAGLDDVRSFNFKHNKNMDIYCEERVLHSLSKEFFYIFDENFQYPGIPRLTTNLIDEQPFLIDNIQVIPIRGMHMKLPVLGFRINDIAYLTDMNTIEDKELEKLQDLSVLVIDALRHETHVSHFNIEQALEIVAKVKPQKSYFTHISHLMGKHADVQATLPENVFLGEDGLVLE